MAASAVKWPSGAVAQAQRLVEGLFCVRFVGQGRAATRDDHEHEYVARSGRLTFECEEKLARVIDAAGAQLGVDEVGPPEAEPGRVGEDLAAVFERLDRLLDATAGESAEAERMLRSGRRAGQPDA